MRKIVFTLSLIIPLALSSCSSDVMKQDFKSWNEDSINARALINYVNEVTNDKSKDFVPIEDRIAVFDMDGTIYSETNPTYFEWVIYIHRVLEDSSYTATQEEIDVANSILKDIEEGKVGSDAEKYSYQSKFLYFPFDGMTQDEFQEYTTNVLDKEVPNFTNLTYGNAFYKPMMDVINYLNKNNFTSYLVSTSERGLCRAMIKKGGVNITTDHVLGTDVVLRGEFQEYDYYASENYELQQGEKLVRTGYVDFKNSKTNKCELIWDHTNKMPVLAFGNTSGDVPMLNYTLNNTYKSMAFMVLQDDNDRESVNLTIAESRKQKWIEQGYNIISMKKEWKTIFGENVTKMFK